MLQYVAYLGPNAMVDGTFRSSGSALNPKRQTEGLTWIKYLFALTDCTHVEIKVFGLRRSTFNP